MFILIFAQQFWNHQCLGFSFHLIFAQNERVTIIYTGWLRIEVSLAFRMFKVHRVPQGNWNWEPPEKTNIDIEKMLKLKIEDSALKPWRAQSTSKDFALRKTSPEYHEIFFWFKANIVLSHECSFQTLYLGFSKRSMFIPIEWSIMPFINLPTTCFHLWPHFSYSPKASQVYTSQISSPGLPGQRPTCPVPGARVQPFPPPGRNERSKNLAFVWIVQKRIQHASSGWLNPTHFKKICVKIGIISKFWSYLNKKNHSNPPVPRIQISKNMVSKTHQAMISNLSSHLSSIPRKRHRVIRLLPKCPQGFYRFGPSDRGSKRAQMPGPGKGKGPVGGPSGLRPPERKITAVKKQKLLKILYILYI